MTDLTPAVYIVSAGVVGLVLGIRIGIHRMMVRPFIRKLVTKAMNEGFDEGYRHRSIGPCSVCERRGKHAEKV